MLHAVSHALSVRGLAQGADALSASSDESEGCVDLGFSVSSYESASCWQMAQMKLTGFLYWYVRSLPSEPERLGTCAGL